MRLDEYQALAARTSQPDQPIRDRLAMACLGLAGETGEVVDIAKKALFHGHQIDHAKLGKELGDVLWYVAEAATTLGLSLEDIARGNIAKLRARYPEGFSSEASQRRVDVTEGVR